MFYCALNFLNLFLTLVSISSLIAVLSGALLKFRMKELKSGNFRAVLPSAIDNYIRIWTNQKRRYSSMHNTHDLNHDTSTRRATMSANASTTLICLQILKVLVRMRCFTDRLTRIRFYTTEVGWD